MANNCKVNVELTIPMGYDIAPGEQPRKLKAEDYFLTFEGSVGQWGGEDAEKRNAIILVKKKPVYYTAEYFSGDGDYMFDIVDIKALEDAFSIIQGYLNFNSITPTDRDKWVSIVEALDRKLITGGTE